MADTLLEFNHAVEGPDGRSYRARVCGRLLEDDRWEGWIEFGPVDGGAGETLCSPRETVQPKRSDLEYWGTGLTPVYLEGALARAVESAVPRVVVVEPPRPPVFDGPAPSPHTVVVEAPPATAILDPFSVYAKGEDVLRQELSALAAWHLRNILRAYALDDYGAPVEALGAAELIELIVSGVRRRIQAAEPVATD